MPRHFLSYWIPETAKAVRARNGEKTLAHSASNQYDRVRKGDTVWIATQSEGDLLLIAKILVEQVTDRDGARDYLQTNEIWEADHHIIAPDDQQWPLQEISLSNVVRDLRFVSKKDRLLIADDGGINPQQLQTMRELEKESADLLQGVWMSNVTPRLDDEVQRLFAQLHYEWDDRNPPDNYRKVRFRNGWEDSTVRHQDYSAATLRRLTWHNLGFRFGKFLGARTGDQIDEVYQILSTSYTKPIATGETTRTLERTDHLGNDDFDWEAEVRGWCRSQNVSPAMTNSIASFFRQSFQYTQCPESAWFGCHPAGVSLVVGGIYLAAIQRSGSDRGLWLVVDQDPPQLSGVEFRPVKSTQSSERPLLWAHADSLELVPDVVAFHPLWESFRGATTRILSSSRSAGNRDTVQERRNKRRLSEIWREDPQIIRAEDADPDDEGYEDEYSPDGVDRRRLVDRQIRERRGQQEFRNTLRERYGDRCLVSACEVSAVLEAAHVYPYRGENDNDPTNGLLLRSDIHTLFDLNLLGIEPAGLRVELNPEVVKEYGRFAGIVLSCAANCRPSLGAMRLRYEQFRRRLCGGR